MVYDLYLKKGYIGAITHLVGGFNPIEKILVKMWIFPQNRGANTQIFETTT